MVRIHHLPPPYFPRKNSNSIRQNLSGRLPYDIDFFRSVGRSACEQVELNYEKLRLHLVIGFASRLRLNPALRTYTSWTNQQYRYRHDQGAGD